MSATAEGPRAHNEAERVDRGALDTLRADLAEARARVGSVIIGHDAAVDEILIALLCGGHALVEGVPGLGKTLMVQTVAQAFGLQFSRIQFTPDLMPGDITGTYVLNRTDVIGGESQFRPGPIFSQLVLADEINRATPKTQSALLEAMQEHQVTAAGTEHRLPRPFNVLATQNPIEMEGTYLLPEAQIDRFLLKIVVAYPDAATLEQIVDNTTGPDEMATVESALTPERLMTLQSAVREIPLSSRVKRYALQLVQATHAHVPGGTEAAKRYVRHGASPRGAQTLVMAGKARALLSGRNNVSVDDIRDMARPALRHRIHLNFDAFSAGMTNESLLDEIVDQVDDSFGKRG